MEDPADKYQSIIFSGYIPNLIDVTINSYESDYTCFC